MVGSHMDRRVRLAVCKPVVTDGRILIAHCFSLNGDDVLDRVDLLESRKISSLFFDFNRHIVHCLPPRYYAASMLCATSASRR